MNNIIKTFLFLLYTKKYFTIHKPQHIPPNGILLSNGKRIWNEIIKKNKTKLEEFSINIDYSINNIFFQFTLNNYYSFEISSSSDYKLYYNCFPYKRNE